MTLNLETLQLILILMPGFIGAGVHGYFRNKALSVASFILVAVLLGMFASLGAAALDIAPVRLPKDMAFNDRVGAVARDPHFYVATLLSCLLGIALALILESRALQHALEKLRLIRHYSTDNVWEQTFRDNHERWLFVHLKDGRRLRGYAKYYSMTGDERALTLGAARLIRPEEKIGRIWRKPDPVDARGDLLLLDMSQVAWIEFVEPPPQSKGKQNE